MERQSIVLNQTHNRDGHNQINLSNSELGNVQLTQITQRVIELAPENIQSSIKKVTKLISQGQQRDAELIISTLELTNSLDNESQSALLALKLLSINTIPNDLIQSLKEKKSNCSNLFVLDLINAALIRNDIITEQTSNAIQRFNQLITPGNLTTSLFLKLVAEHKYIQKFYKEHCLDLTDETLISIAYGYLRVNAIDDAFDIIKNLSCSEDDLSIKKLRFLCNAAKLNNIFLKSDYWSLSINNKLLFDDVIRDLKAYIAENVIDDDIINVTASCLDFLDFEEQELIQLCNSNREQMSGFPQDVKEALLYIKTKNSKVFSNQEITEVIELQTDSQLRASVIDKITHQLKLSPLQYKNIQFILTNEKLRELIAQGLTVETEDSFVKDLSKLKLLTLSAHSPLSSSDREDITSLVKKVIANENYRIESKLVLSIAKDLQKYSLHQYAIQLVSLNLQKNTWLSPLHEFYLELLFQAKQYSTLKHRLQLLPVESWNINCWAHRVNLLQFTGDLCTEIETIESLTTQYAHNISIWSTLISAYERADEHQKIVNVISKIPIELFERPTEQAWTILFSLLRHDQFHYIEPIILNWFIDNPEKVSVPISNFVLNGAMINAKFDFSSHVKHIHSCYVLDNKYGTKRIKLIVDGYQGQHTNIINSQSPNAKSLLKGDVGDIIDFGIEEFTIKEILPPFLGVAWRIAPSIRTQQNDGSDAFQLIELPSSEDENEVISSITQVLTKLSPSSKPNKIQKHSQIPIQIKGHLLFKSDILEAAIKVILDKDCFKNSMPETESNSNTWALDIYSIIFISIFDLYHGNAFEELDCIITQETRDIIEKWLTRAKKEHLRAGIGEQGNLVVIDEENILNQKIISGIEWVLKHSSVTKRQLMNLPIELTKLEEFLDISTFSTLSICAINNYSYLTFDRNMCHLLKETELTFSNAQYFFLSQLEKQSLKQQQETLNLLYSTNFIVPVQYKTVVNFARTQNSTYLELIIKILHSWKVSSPNDQNFLNLMGYLISVGINYKFLADNIIDDSLGTKLAYSALNCARPDKVANGYIEDIVVGLFIKVLEGTNAHKQYFNFVLSFLFDFAKCNFLDTEYITSILSSHFQLSS